MGTIQPSDISGVIIAGAFNDSRVEAAAMFVTGYLAAHNADWDKEFTWHEFATWVDNGATGYVNELYVSMVELLGANRIIINSIHRLIPNHIARRDSDGDTYFKMTPRLIDLIQRFAAHRMSQTG